MKLTEGFTFIDIYFIIITIHSNSKTELSSAATIIHTQTQCKRITIPTINNKLITLFVAFFAKSKITR